jgi:hypothetical protein
MFKVCNISVGEINLKNSVISTNQILNPTNIIFFFNDDDKAFSYAVKSSSDRFVVDICKDYGVPDGATLRNSIPDYLKKDINNILLSSVDFEEMDDEGLEYLSFYPLENENVKYETLDNFELGENYIAVQSIYGWFNFSEHLLKSPNINKLKDGSLEEEFYVSQDEIGIIENFISETDKIILFKK